MSSLYSIFVACVAKCLPVHPHYFMASEDPDQAVHMHILIWINTGWKCSKVDFPAAVLFGKPRTHTDSKGYNQTVLMYRLIRVYAGCICPKIFWCSVTPNECFASETQQYQHVKTSKYMYFLRSIHFWSEDYFHALVLNHYL